MAPAAGTTYVLSLRRNDKRVVTIEVDVRRKRIKAAKGRCNSQPGLSERNILGIWQIEAVTSRPDLHHATMKAFSVGWLHSGDTPGVIPAYAGIHLFLSGCVQNTPRTFKYLLGGDSKSQRRGVFSRPRTSGNRTIPGEDGRHHGRRRFSHAIRRGLHHQWLANLFSRMGLTGRDSQ
jgi:hypothetical protein